MSNDSAGHIPGTKKPGEFENLPFTASFTQRFSQIGRMASAIRDALLPVGDRITVADAVFTVLVPGFRPVPEPLLAQLLVTGTDGLTTAVICMPDDRTANDVKPSQNSRPDRIVIVDRRDLQPHAIERTVSAIAGPGRTRARGSPRRR